MFVWYCVNWSDEDVHVVCDNFLQQLKWWRLVGVDKSEFKPRWTSLTGTMMVETMVMTFFSLITMDNTEIYHLYWCCGCSIDERFGVVISTRWTMEMCNHANMCCVWSYQMHLLQVTIFFQSNHVYTAWWKDRYISVPDQQSYLRRKGTYGTTLSTKAWASFLPCTQQIESIRIIGRWECEGMCNIAQSCVCVHDFTKQYTPGW